jgi:hypothetical protein
MMSEAELLFQAEKYCGWGYSLTLPRYPERLPGVSTPQAPLEETNCVCFLEGVIVPVATRMIPYFNWGITPHRDMMIQNITRPFSPIDALHDTKAGFKVRASHLMPWTVVQGWREGFISGHLFAVVRHDPETDKVLVLEASGTLGGPGWRDIGRLARAGCEVPKAWILQSKTTWEQLKRQFPHRQMATLNVSLDQTRESP